MQELGIRVRVLMCLYLEERKNVHLSSDSQKAHDLPHTKEELGN